MNLQFVFGNPSKKRDKKSKKAGRKKMAKRRHKKTKARNPEKFRATLKRPTGAVTKAGKKKYRKVESKTSDPIMTGGEVAAAKARVRIMKEQIRGLKGPKRKKAISIIKASEKVLGSRVVKRDQVKNQMAMFKQMAETATPGDKVSVKTITLKAKQGKKAGKRKATKRKATKRKFSKRKHKATKRKNSKRKHSKRAKKSRLGGRVVLLARKGSKATIRPSRKRSSPKLTIVKTSSNPAKKKHAGKKKHHASKRRAKKRGSMIKLTAGRKTVTLKTIKGKGKKMKSATYRLKANPLGGSMDAFEKFTGHTLQEAGSLALGGALYGAINKVIATQATKIPGVGSALQAVQKLPVVGGAVPTLLVGALMNYLGERQKIEALKMLGTGLVGASVVGMGVSAGQMVPGLSSMSGIDYTPDMGALPAGLGALPAGLGDGADFGGVDYTLDGHDMGEIPYGDVEYTEDEHSEDFGMLPQGLGHGQLG